MTISINEFRAGAVARYENANREMLEWMLPRPALHGAFLDTKVDALTGRGYGAADGLRGPDWIYGWIQGRGLEALATFAHHYRTHDPALAERLSVRCGLKAVARLPKRGPTTFSHSRMPSSPLAAR